MDTGPGFVFNLGGGPANAVSLRTLLAHIGDLLGREVELSFEDWRAGDQRYFVADTRAVASELGLASAKPWRKGVTELARWLRGKPITVVTNAINVATELYNHSLTKVIVTGGALNSYSYELVGEMVGFTLQEYRLDLCFVGCSGVTPDFGFSMRDPYESAVARAFLKVSERAVVVADHSKIGQKTLAKFAPLSATERLITDEGLSEAWQYQLAEAGLTVELAPGLRGAGNPGGG